jgi:hypothetical protein
MRSFFRVFRVLPWLFFTPDAQLSTIRLTAIAGEYALGFAGRWLSGA